MAHERIISLLTSHQVRIARALTRQVQGLSPNYATLEPAVLEQSFVRFLGYTARFLSTGDDEALKDYAAHTAQLRGAIGFRIDDFMLATLVFLPVLRQFLIERASNLEAGMKDYEALEAVAIPLMAEAASVFRRANARFIDGDDDDDDITAPNGMRHQPKMTRKRFTLESVTGEAADELSPFR